MYANAMGIKHICGYNCPLGIAKANTDQTVTLTPKNRGATFSNRDILRNIHYNLTQRSTLVSVININLIFIHAPIAKEADLEL